MRLQALSEQLQAGAAVGLQHGWGVLGNASREGIIPAVPGWWEMLSPNGDGMQGAHQRPWDVGSLQHTEPGGLPGDVWHLVIRTPSPAMGDVLVVAVPWCILHMQCC